MNDPLDIDLAGTSFDSIYYKKGKVTSWNHCIYN